MTRKGESKKWRQEQDRSNRRKQEVKKERKTIAVNRGVRELRTKTLMNYKIRTNKRGGRVLGMGPSPVGGPRKKERKTNLKRASLGKPS